MHRITLLYSESVALNVAKGLFAWVLAAQPKSGLSLVYLKKELFKFSQYEFPSDENYINFTWVHNLPFEMLLCVGCSNVATNTIVPVFHTCFLNQY